MTEEVATDPARHQRLIAAALAELPDGWTVLHDISWRGRQHRNIDHVVIGPAGVFVIDSLKWRGLVHVWESTLYHDGQPQQREIADAKEAAAAVAVLTPGVPRHAVWAVLCLGRDEPLKGQAGHVLVGSTATVAEVLTTQVHVLSSEQRRVAVKQLQERLHNRSAIKVASKVAHTEEKRSAKRQRHAKPGRPVEQHSNVTRRRRPRNGSFLPLAMAVGAGILFIGYPDVVMNAAANVREFVEQLLN